MSAMSPLKVVAPAPDTSNLTQRAYAALKSKVIRLGLPPGSTFTEATLAAELGISKTPVREALVRLAREGLVEPVARSGYIVKPVTLKDVSDLFEVRLLLEGEAAALAATRLHNADDLRRLDELCRTSYDPRDPDDVAHFVEANAKLHSTIGRAGGNDELAALLQQVLDKLERVFYLSVALSERVAESVHEHGELVEAIAAGDAKRAREVALAQIHASRKMVMDAFLASPALQSTSIVARVVAPRARSRRPTPTGARRRIRGASH
jgi:DNA-binding GntR family transcriptional regulator